MTCQGVRRFAVTLEEQFACLVADVAQQQLYTAPRVLQPVSLGSATRTLTVYSVGEAISQKGLGQNAKLGAGSFRDTGARR
jgi:hypothetical protein